MQDNLINLFKSKEKLSEKWVLLILLLFPIAGPVVRHWNGTLFILMAFTALYFLFAKKDRKPLYKEEKVYLWTFFLFFCIFLLSGTVNNWSLIQAKDLGGEFKFLLFIPMYLLIREYADAQKVFYAGVLLSIPVIFSFSVYEYIYVLPDSQRQNLNGAYFHLFIGPIMAALLLMSYFAYKEWFKEKNYYWLFPIYAAMGLFVIIFSQARLAHLTIIGGAIVLLFLLVKKLKFIIAGVGVIILIMISAYQIDSIEKRVQIGITDVSNYFSHSEDVKSNVHLTSWGSRLSVWFSAKHVFNERPLVGIGNKNYPAFIKSYVDKGLVSRVTVKFSTAHNTFVEALISKGLIGLVLLLMIFYYPVYVAWKNRRTSYITFAAISTFATALTLMSLGASMLINKYNGMSFLLFFSAVLFSSMIQKIKQDNS